MPWHGHFNSLKSSYFKVFNSVVETDGINYLQIAEKKCKLATRSKNGKIHNKYSV